MFLSVVVVGLPCTQAIPLALRSCRKLATVTQDVRCRVAAVHGAVYVLRQPIHSLLLDPETRQCKGVQTNTGQVSIDIVVTGASSVLGQRHLIASRRSCIVLLT